MRQPNEKSLEENQGDIPLSQAFSNQTNLPVVDTSVDYFNAEDAYAQVSLADELDCLPRHDFDNTGHSSDVHLPQTSSNRSNNAADDISVISSNSENPCTQDAHDYLCKHDIADIRRSDHHQSDVSSNYSNYTISFPVLEQHPSSKALVSESVQQECASQLHHQPNRLSLERNSSPDASNRRKSNSLTHCSVIVTPIRLNSRSTPIDIDQSLYGRLHSHTHHKSIFKSVKDERIFISIFDDLIQRDARKEVVTRVEILRRAHTSLSFLPVYKVLKLSFWNRGG